MTAKKIAELKEIGNMRKMIWRFVFCMRPFSWFFRRNWYATCRWNTRGAFDGEKLYLLDIGAITIGFSHQFKDL